MTYYPMGAVAAPQYVPMGWFGDAVSRSAPVIGGTVGGITSALTKSPALGGFVGGVTNVIARDYGHLIPFQAGPQMAAPMGYAPQGMWGNLISGAGNIVGGLVGGNTGRVIQDASGLARFLPFEAGPQMGAPMGYAPQGAFGNFVRDVAPIVGQHVGGNWGRVISTVGSLGDMLPFAAGPQMAPAPVAYAPQGMWGNLIAGAGNLAGNIVGGNTGRTISAVSGLGRYLPFEAGPGQIASAPEPILGGDPNMGAEPMVAVADGAGQVAYVPQGIWGSLIAGAGNLAGGLIGGKTGRLVRDVSSLGNLLPFAAGPGQVAYAPQGMWGNLISGAGNIVGGLVGGNTGQVIRDASGLARFLPFEAGPQMAQAPVAYAPQGFFGGLGGSLLGGAIGGAFGHRDLGSAIGGIAGSFLPLQAMPMTNGYAGGDTIVYH